MKFNICLFLILLCIGILPGVIYLIAYAVSEKEPSTTQQVIVNIQQPQPIIQRPISIQYCTKCGSKNTSENKFCENCGAILFFKD